MSAGPSDPIDRIARTLLYEGYLLYPYRRSALKNQQPFNFGVLHPRESSRVKTGGESWQLQTQVLVIGEPEATTFDLSVRFLQITPALEGTRPAQDATERQADVRCGTLSALRRAVLREVFTFPAEPKPLRMDVEVTADSVEGAGTPCAMVTVRVANVTPPPSLSAAPLSYDEALTQALVSTHVALGVTGGGEFVSLLDPPDALRAAATGCRNHGVWPVLFGEDTCRTRMLASPIILYDYPQIAPESAGDLFDATEIDEILALRILTMTDDEKREVREGDESARQMLDRTEALGEDHWRKLHGAVRGLRHVTRESS